jgi:dUTP pyrophosphatase
MKILKIRDVKTPSRGTPESAGLDFYVPNDYMEINIWPGGSRLIPSGIKAAVPKNFMLCAFNKSGVATRQGLQVGACIVDSDYQGEIHLHVTNISTTSTVIVPGQKLVQFVLLPVLYSEVEVVDDVETLFPEVTIRAEGGFGSTGVV